MEIMIKIMFTLWVISAAAIIIKSIDGRSIDDAPKALVHSVTLTVLLTGLFSFITIIAMVWSK